MKLLTSIFKLLLVGLLVTVTKADISLKLRNKSYLPPPIQDVPIKEVFSNIQGNSQQQTFQQAKYANSRYQIFKVHNHYEPSVITGINKQKLSVNSNYLPPQKEEIHIEHINAPADFPLDDPNLDASYLSLASGSNSNNQQIIVKHETRIAAANTNPSNNIKSNQIKSNHIQSNNIFYLNVPLPLPSNYQHKPIKSTQNIQGDQQQQKHVGINFNTQHQTQHFSQQHVQNSVADQQYHHTSQQSTPKSNTIKNNQYMTSIPNESIVGQMPTQNVVQNSFKGPEYLPPNSVNNGKSGNKGYDYSPPHKNGSAKQNTGFKGPEISASHQQGIAQQQQTVFQQNFAFKGPDYLPPHQQDSARQQQISYQKNSPFKGPDYLPPHQDVSDRQQHTSFQQNSAFKGPDYLPPHQQSSAQQQHTSIQRNSPFKGPDYLPPHRNQMPQQENQYQDFQKPKNSEQAIAELHTFPEQSQQKLTVETQNQQAGHEQYHDFVYGSAKQANAPQSASLYQAPGYLPPSYITPKHSQGPQQQQYPKQQYLAPDNTEQARQPTQTQISTPFRTNQYLPPDYIAPKPENSEQAINQLHSLSLDEQSTSHTASEDLGEQTLNEFKKPAEAEQSIGQNYPAQQNTYQNLQNQQTIQSYNQASQHTYTQTGVSQQSQPQVSQQSQLFHSQRSQQLSYSQNLQEMQQIKTIFKGSNYLPPAATASQSESHNYKAPEYLPPVTSSQPILPEITQTLLPPLPPVSSSPINQAQQLSPATEYLASSQAQLQQNTQPLVHSFKGPEYLPSQNSPQVSSFLNYPAPQQSPQFKAPDYLPPPIAAPTQPIHLTVMNPLSSYMTRIQPHERYGNARKPFPVYGPSPTKAATSFANDGISSMYREPANRPQYYAPAMPYNNNAPNTQSYTTYTQNQYQQISPAALNQQTRQTLQTFMPKDIRQKITLGAKTSLLTTKPTAAKIRTVQIVNHTNVKTLKVLESLDHVGIKTIKILGHSHEQPMGDHRVVKVVSGHDQTEQTVKIFHDQQDVNSTVDQYSPSNTSNGYLPPRRKRNSKKSSRL